jgi:membrane protein implicated in regulation of membrane protease activity
MGPKTIIILMLIIVIWLPAFFLAIYLNTLLDWICFGVTATILSVSMYYYIRELTYNKNTDEYWDK